MTPDATAETGAIVDAEVTVCSDGPYLVRGARRVIDASGVSHDVKRPVVAVCRCGKSGRTPWCDGTHKLM